MRHIVTTGRKYVDIDGLACVVAYHELLENESRNTTALLQATWNYTIPENVKGWGLRYKSEYISQPDDRFVIMDVSNVDYIHGFLDEDKIDELYDHHFGFEDYWVKKLGHNAHIEKVGSCATLVVEQWQKRLPKISPSGQSANLLGLSIVSNTLNLQSFVTDPRDSKALEYVKGFMTLGILWVEEYFREKDSRVYARPLESISNDTKIVRTPFITQTCAIAQIELWEGSGFVDRNEEIITQLVRNSEAHHWLLTVVSIRDGHNYLYTTSEEVKTLLSDKIGAKFTGDKGVTPTLILRKEVLREIHA